MSAEYTPDHPRMQAAKARFDTAREAHIASASRNGFKQKFQMVNSSLLKEISEKIAEFGIAIQPVENKSGPTANHKQFRINGHLRELRVLRSACEMATGSGLYYGQIFFSPRMLDRVKTFIVYMKAPNFPTRRFIIPSSVLKKISNARPDAARNLTFYIPMQRAVRRDRTYKRKIDFEKYEEAWHLLAQ